MYYIYILTNKGKSVLYIGVTNNLYKIVCEHKNKERDGFTKRYCVDKLIYYETFSDIMDAISREKQLKSWTRRKKEALIATQNPNWDELLL